MGTQDVAQGSSDTGDTTAINNSPTVSQRNADLDLDTLGFRDKEKKVVVFNISMRQHVQTVDH